MIRRSGVYTALLLDTDLLKMALRACKAFEKRALGREHCVVFLGKALYSQSASLHPGVGVLANWGNLKTCGGVTYDGLASRPGGVEILLAASCYRNRDKLRQL